MPVRKCDILHDNTQYDNDKIQHSAGILSLMIRIGNTQHNDTQYDN
jgi:hypothetical protein